jgi:eukaryotic-like serine/threonine-protein kinase
VIGRTISHYRIVDEISRGGMGIVYRAVDTALNREVALKILPPELVADDDRRARFIQEARAASALEHPHIAVIHEVGQADGVYFIAMELIRGEKLSDVLARGALTLDRALDVAVEIAEALARAHEKGIVHRDLKPQNVMVTEYGHAKIIDFGLAKLVEPVATGLSGETGALAKTDPGVMLGTVAYMAPEQARGQKVDHRADVFAFGVMCYEMLAGDPPFRATSGLDTLHAILNAPAPPLPAAAFHPELDRIIRKCLEKDPDARYQGMRDLVVDLRAVRRRSDAAAPSVRGSAVGRPAPRGRKMRWAIAGALLAAVAVAAVLVVRRAQAPDTTALPSAGAASSTGKPSVAVMYFENNTGNPSLDWLRTGLTDMIVTDLSQSPNVEVLGTDRLYQILTELRRQDDRQVSFDVVQEVAKRAGIQNVVLGSYVKAGDVIRINLKLQEARTGRIITSERVDAAGESNLLSMVDTLTNRIRSRFDVRPAPAPEPLVGKAPAAIAARPVAEASLPVSWDRELRDVTTSSIEAYRYYVEGIDLHNQLKEAQSLPLFERAVAIDPGFAMAYAKLAIVHNNLNHMAESSRYAKLAIDRADRLTPRERYYIEGLYYSRMHRELPKAIEAYKKGLQLYPEHVSARNNLAIAYVNVGQLDLALPQYEDAVRRRSPFASAYGNLASVYLATGQPDKAETLLGAYAKEHPESGYGQYMLAILHLRLGRLDEAAAALSRARSMGVSDWRADLAAYQIALGREDWAGCDSLARAISGSRDPFAQWMGSMQLATTALYRGRSAQALRFLEDAATKSGADREYRAIARSDAVGLLLARGEPRLAMTLAGKMRDGVEDTSAEAEVLRAEANAFDMAGGRDAADRALARLRTLGEPELFLSDRRTGFLAEGGGGAASRAHRCGD